MSHADPPTLPRRYEIDALRSIALVLLIIYHVFCAFQPFAPAVRIIGSPHTLEGLWFLGELINTWRIPVLFLLAGITAGYLLNNRSVGSLLQSRLMRLVPPLLFTWFLAAPISSALFQQAQGEAVRYLPNSGHLWFVWNLVVYFVLAVPLLLYLKLRRDNLLLRLLRPLPPLAWLPLLSAVLAAVTIFLEPHIAPESFAAHFLRFWYGLASFLAGILLVSLGDPFWRGIRRIAPVALAAALALYLLRMSDGVSGASWVRLAACATESACGMLAFLGYGCRWFSRRSQILPVINRAAFAIYILHLPVQQAAALLLFKSELPALLTFPLLIAATFAGSIVIYLAVLRWTPWLHPLLGIPPVKPAAPAKPDASEAIDPAKPAASPNPPARRWANMVARFSVLYLITPVIVLLTIAVLVWTSNQRPHASPPAGGPGTPGDLALREAIFDRDLDRVRSTLEQGADVNRRFENGWTAFAMAVFARNPQAMEIMLAHDPDLAIRSREGRTLLWAAAWMADHESFRLLWRSGAADGLAAADWAAIREVIDQPYLVTATQIRFFRLEPPAELDFHTSRDRIRELLRQRRVIERREP